MAKVFIVDVALCNGCHNCQLACKDEHCGQPWPPYAKAQPTTGQFWMKVDAKERGEYPVVKVSYTPKLCNHCSDAPCVKAGNGAVYRRDDGMVIIDPEKSIGMRELVDSCPIGAVYFNEELNVPQKCTGCAHLLDAGWKAPRCVDACPTEALRFVEESELDMEDLETLDEVSSFGPRVYFRNLPKRLIAGMAVDGGAQEVVIGATVSLCQDGKPLQVQTTDDFGDFKFERIDSGVYEVVIEAPSFARYSTSVDATEKDVYIGDVFLDYTGSDTAERRIEAQASKARGVMKANLEKDAQRRSEGKYDSLVQVDLDKMAKLSEVIISEKTQIQFDE